MRAAFADRAGVVRAVPGEPFFGPGGNGFLPAARRQDRRLRSTVAEPGTIRRFWRNLFAYTGAAPPFNWTRNGFATEPAPAGAVTTPRRYLISTRDTLTAGNQRSMPMLRPALRPSVLHPSPPLVLAGNIQYRPTIRARVISFGSRIPAENG